VKSAGEQVGRPPNPRISRDLTIEEPVKKPMKSQKESGFGAYMFRQINFLMVKPT
jgi:hypothetical protein